MPDAAQDNEKEKKKKNKTKRVRAMLHISRWLTLSCLCMALRLIPTQRRFAACHFLPSVIPADRLGTNVQKQDSILQVHECQDSRLLSEI